MRSHQDKMSVNSFQNCEMRMLVTKQSNTPLGVSFLLLIILIHSAYTGMHACVRAEEYVQTCKCFNILLFRVFFSMLWRHEKLNQ